MADVEMSDPPATGYRRYRAACERAATTPGSHVWISPRSSITSVGMTTVPGIWPGRSPPQRPALITIPGSAVRGLPPIPTRTTRTWRARRRTPQASTPMAHTATTCVSGGIPVLPIPAHCAFDRVEHARRRITELCRRLLARRVHVEPAHSNAFERDHGHPTGDPHPCGVHAGRRSRDRIWQPVCPLRPSGRTRDEPPELRKREVHPTRDVALARPPA